MQKKGKNTFYNMEFYMEGYTTGLKGAARNNENPIENLLSIKESLSWLEGWMDGQELAGQQLKELSSLCGEENHQTQKSSHYLLVYAIKQGKVISTLNPPSG
jgi:hypothetical protein